jgi:hypothetical protein
LLKQSGDDDKDDEDDEEEEDNEEMWRSPGDDAVPPLHEEEEAIGSILALEWDNLEREEEEDDVPQRPLGPFPLHAMGQGEENIPPGVVDAGHPILCGLLEQHTG